MSIQPALSASSRPWVLPVATTAVALAILAADASTPPECVVSGLYVLVVLMAGRFCRGRSLLFVCAGCAGLTIAAQFLSDRLAHGLVYEVYIGAFNALVSIVAISLSGFLVLRGQAAQAALLRTQADLARISRATTMGELTASIAHEVNQPIAAVVTNAGACLRWLAGDQPDLEKARAAANRIVRDGTRAAEVIRRIRLVFTKGEAPRTRIDLNQLVRDTIGLMAAEAPRHDVTVRTNLRAGLPPVTGDPVQLQQVLLNLLVNGLEAMKTAAGPRELTVTSALTEEGEAMVRVADTGVGLPADVADRLFDPFFTTKPDGTGMGLSISRSIIDAHQGRLWAQENAPKGAAFVFVLPAHGEGPGDAGPA
jgi:signal transduction histidine kinase